MGCANSSEALPHTNMSKQQWPGLGPDSVALDASHVPPRRASIITVASDGTLSRRSARTDLLAGSTLSPREEPSTTFTSQGHASSLHETWESLNVGLGRSACRLNVAMLNMNRQMLLNDEYDRRSRSAHPSADGSSHSFVLAWRRNVITPAQ